MSKISDTFQDFRSKCPESPIHSKISNPNVQTSPIHSKFSDPNVQNLQYIPKFQIQMSKISNTFQNFRFKCPKSPIHSKISDPNVQNLQYILKFQIKMSTPLTLLALWIRNLPLL